MRLQRALAWLAITLVAACAAEDPDSAIRSLVASAEAAAEARDTGFFRDLIATSYVDNHGNDRDHIIDLIRGYFLVNREIEVVTRLERVELSGSDAAEVVVLAGLLGRQPEAGVLSGLDGRLYRLELELVAASGEWQLIGARWERSLDALLGD